MPIRRADDEQYTLGVGLSATGQPVAIKGGEYIFFASGNLTTAVCSLEARAPNGLWFVVQVFTGSLVRFTSLPGSQTAIGLPATDVRVALTGGGTPNGIAAYLIGLG